MGNSNSLAVVGQTYSSLLLIIFGIISLILFFWSLYLMVVISIGAGLIVLLIALLLFLGVLLNYYLTQRYQWIASIEGAEVLVRALH